MKAFVNSLSIFRIIAAFLLIPIMIFQMYWLTFILFVLAGFSDTFDGILARKYNVTSKIGGVLDHMGDKFLVANTMIMLAIMIPVWFVIVPIIIMIARELYISGLREFIGTQKMEMPVPVARFSMGKIKATLQMVSVGAFLLMFALGTTMTSFATSKIMIWITYALPMVVISGLWMSLLASIWSATEYTITFAKKIKTLK